MLIRGELNGRSADPVIIHTNSQRLFNEGGTFDLGTFNVATYDSANKPEKAHRNLRLAAP